jgi:aryl-alcohol dehydrogenase-like predicted oxidoreductase
MERDIIPMCRHNGMSIAPWAVLGQGKFKTPEELEKRANLRGGAKPTPAQLQTAKILQEVADEIGGGVHLAHGEHDHVHLHTHAISRLGVG